jgi:hypothetical protein
MTPWAPGYHALMTMSEYLADPCAEPALSTSAADALIRRSALHAMAEHPRLGGKRGDGSKEADTGSAAHALLFGGAPVRYVEQVTKRSGPEKGQSVVPRDWSTKDAQEARDAIRAEGGIPMLPHDRVAIEGIATAAREALATLGGANISHETTMLWQMEGVWSRGRTDYLDDVYDIDLKTCDNADPFDFLAYLSPKIATQKAMRSLGHKALGHPRQCVWLLVERDAPHAWSFVGMGPAKLAIAEARVLWAARQWRKCLDTKTFPGFRKDIHWADPKPWEDNEFAERVAAKE